MTHALQVLHTLQWHHPGGRALRNWLKPPLRTTTPTRTLYWVLLKNMSWVLATLPVKKTREHSAAKQLWPNRGRHNAFPLLGLGGKRCACVHGADVDGVGPPALPQAEGSYLFV